MQVYNFSSCVSQSLNILNQPCKINGLSTLLQASISKRYMGFSINTTQLKDIAHNCHLRHFHENSFKKTLDFGNYTLLAKRHGGIKV